MLSYLLLWIKASVNEMLIFG